MSRLFWLGLGVAAGVLATRKASGRNPAGVTADLADGLREIGAGLGAFGAEVRAGMLTREQELTELVERRTGSALPTYADALAEEPAPRSRARRAGA